MIQDMMKRPSHLHVVPDQLRGPHQAAEASHLKEQLRVKEREFKGKLA